MQRMLWLLPCLVLLGLSYLRSQPSRFATSPGVSNALTRVLRTDGTVTAGLFIGLMEDSVSLVVGGRLQKISRHQMWRLTMERKAERGSTTIASLLLSIYAGNVAFFRVEDQPFAFMQTSDFNGPLTIIASNVAFAFVGVGVGYLVEASDESEEVFEFGVSEEVSQQEWNRLRTFVSRSEHNSRVHVSFQGSWVDTYLPNSTDYSYNYFSSARVSNLNMMRKIQLALTFTPLLDGGIAIMWLGQPSHDWSNYSSFVSTSGSVQMMGHGYYALGILKPLHSLALRNVQWDVGAGIGVASVDYHDYQKTYTYPDTLLPIEVTRRETLISGMLYTEVKVFLSDYFSLGVTGDYVFIPEKTPTIREINIGSRSMGTASIGFALGLHF